MPVRPPDGVPGARERARRDFWVCGRVFLEEVSPGDGDQVKPLTLADAGGPALSAEGRNRADRCRKVNVLHVGAGTPVVSCPGQQTLLVLRCRGLVVTYIWAVPTPASTPVLHGRRRPQDVSASRTV